MTKAIVALVCLIVVSPLHAQINPALQDSTLNNLVHPKGYRTSTPGALGRVEKSGSGTEAMVLIPGLGFGGDVFESLAQHYKDRYVIYAVTPAGFGGTHAPPMPKSGTSNGALTWTNGIVHGVLDLIKKEKLNKPVIVAHFVTGTQVALNLALDHPEKIGKMIIAGGSPTRYNQSRVNGQWSWLKERVYTPEARAAVVDTFWAPRWFKTVTKKTWDANMWTADTYCKDSIRGGELFKASADVSLQVMIRYLIEWMAYDASGRFKELSVPTLVLIPDFKVVLPDVIPNDSSLNNIPKIYLKYFHQETWRPARESGNPMLRFQVVPDTRLFMWYDKPKAVYKAINAFLEE